MKYSLFCVLILCFAASGDCVFRHTNIGKFVEGIFTKIRDHSLTIPKNRYVDKHTLEQAFVGFRNLIDDPLTINEQQLNYEMDKVVKIRGHVKNLEIKFLRTMILEHIFMSNDTLYTEIIVTVPQLRVIGLYNTSCYLNHYDFDLYGNGSFQWDLSEFKIKANITLDKMTTGFMQLKKISMDQSFNSSKFEIKNLLNDEDVSSVVSEIVSIVIPPLHNYFKPTINDFFTRLIALYSEVLFSNITLEEFLGIIHAFKDKATNNNVV